MKISLGWIEVSYKVLFFGQSKLRLRIWVMGPGSQTGWECSNHQPISARSNLVDFLGSSLELLWLISSIPSTFKTSQHHILNITCWTQKHMGLEKIPHWMTKQHWRNTFFPNNCNPTGFLVPPFSSKICSTCCLLVAASAPSSSLLRPLHRLAPKLLLEWRWKATCPLCNVYRLTWLTFRVLDLVDLNECTIHVTVIDSTE